MKSRKIVSLILTLCLIIADAPLSAFAESGEMRTMEIVINAGESISVWNTDIAASGVASNTITVLVEDGTDYDMVFPEGSGTAAMLSHCQEGIDRWNTADYIKADNSAADGMLLRLNVNSGTARLRIESRGSNLSAEPLTPYTDDGEIFSYLSAEKDQTADFYLPQNCNLSNITLMMCATVGTEIKRIIDTTTNGYELYGFTQESLTVCSYSDGSKTGSFAIPYTSAYAKDGEIYYCAKVIVPEGTYAYNVGSMKTVEGSAFYLTPEFAHRDETKRTAWDQNVSSGGFYAPASYDSLVNKFHDNETNLSITGRNAERTPENLEIAVYNQEGIIRSICDPGDNLSNADALLQEGTSRRLEALRMKLTGELNDTNYGVWYRVHNQSYGWLGWAEDGEETGTTGTAGLQRRAEAVELNLLPHNKNIYITGGTADRDTAETGNTVNITACVPEGYCFAGWECNNPDISFDKSAPTVSVLVSGEQKDILFSAKTEPVKYAVTVGSAGEGGAVIPIPPEATAGTEVSVFVTPASGYTVASVTGYADGYFDIAPSETELNKYTFTMPAKNVELSASFTKISYPVSVSAENGTLVSNKQTAQAGDTVTLTLTPQSSLYRLGSLSVRGGGENIETTKVNDSTYTFTMPAGDVTASAMFAMDYFVSFENWNGEILEYCDLTAGQTPEYNGETPVREANEIYTFTFAGWDKPIEAVSGNDPYVKYTATYTAVPRSYPVTFLGTDGRVLQSGNVLYGETPVYSGETPVKATDENYVYTFEKWEPDIASVTGEATYTPVFSATPVLHEGRNPFTLTQYEPVICLFVPEKSGYYRFWTVGDNINPECTVKDGAGNDVMIKKFYTERGNQLSCECIALLEAGATYGITAEAWSASGNISLYIRNVDMHTVYLDQNTENGRVEGEEEGVSYMAYSGQIISPYAVPDAGYGLVAMTVTDEDGNYVTEEKDGYVMPNSDVYVTATFAPAHKIDYDMDYGITFMNNDAVFTDWVEETEMLEDRAAAGVCVEYKLGWDDGSIIDEFGIKTTGGDDVPFSCFWQYSDKMDVWFTMPDEPVIITAKAAEAYILTLDPGITGGKSLQYAVKSGAETNIPKCPFKAPDGKILGGWTTTEGGAVEYRSGDDLTLNNNVTLFAVWADKPYTETAVSTENGSTLLTVGLYNMPGEVTLAAAAYKDGRMVYLDFLKTTKSSETFTLSCDYDEIKVFAWENTESLKPVTDAEKVRLS